MCQLQRISRGAQLRRQPKRQAHRHGAAVALERDDRKAVPRRQHMLLNGGFESVVMRNDNPSRIRRGFDEFRRHRIARAPQLHGIVVDGICHAQNFRRRVSRVLVRADLLQAELAPGFDVAKQDVRDSDVDLDLRCGGAAAHAWRYRQLCGKSLNRPASAGTTFLCWMIFAASAGRTRPPPGTT